MVTVTGGHDTGVSLAALIAIRPGCRPRLIHRTHRTRRGDKRKGFTETGYARFLDAAHQQLGSPVVLVWDGLNTHTSRAMRELIAARTWLTVFRFTPAVRVPALTCPVSSIAPTARPRRRPVLRAASSSPATANRRTTPIAATVSQTARLSNRWVLSGARSPT